MKIHVNFLSLLQHRNANRRHHCVCPIFSINRFFEVLKALSQICGFFSITKTETNCSFLSAHSLDFYSKISRRINNILNEMTYAELFFLVKNHLTLCEKFSFVYKVEAECVAAHFDNKIARLQWIGQVPVVSPI